MRSGGIRRKGMYLEDGSVQGRATASKAGRP